MFKPKHIIFLLILCFVHKSLSAPANKVTDDVDQGRGIGSTVWGWVTYPFTWWSSDSGEQPVTDHLIGSTTYPYQDIEIGKRNVTVWCNDQTCTTMKCDKSGCRNISCNVYDTDMNGECREYNTNVKPEEPVTSNSIDSTDKPAVELTTVGSEVSSELISTHIDSSKVEEERPIELEAVLSSTVLENNKSE